MWLIEWIPESLYAPLLALKGLMAGAGVVLLVIHMNHVLPTMKTRGQKGRYFLLLAYAVLSAGATFEQIDPETALTYGYRNLAALVLNTVLIWVMVQSMIDHRKHKTQRER